jgi:hypothetical protein
LAPFFAAGSDAERREFPAHIGRASSGTGSTLIGYLAAFEKWLSEFQPWLGTRPPLDGRRVPSKSDREAMFKPLKHHIRPHRRPGNLLCRINMDVWEQAARLWRAGSNR